MKRRVIRIILTVLFVVHLFPNVVSAQRVFMGYSNKQDGFIYEDCVLDGDMRFIMSEVWDIGDYAFSLCRFDVPEGKSWYGLAIESKEFVPKNGNIVFVPESEGSVPVRLFQTRFDNATVSRTKSELAPSLIFGGGGSSIFFSTYRTTIDNDVFFAIYDLEEPVLMSLINTRFREIRIANKSTYNSLKPWVLTKMSGWLEESKCNLDVRSQLSVNLILENL